MTNCPALSTLPFGANVDPLHDVDAAVGRTRLAEELGFDLALMQDHAYNPRFVETWTLLRAYNVMGRLTLPGDRPRWPRDASTLWGDAALWSETLTMLARDHRIDTFVFWPAGERQADQLRAFAEHVIPAVTAART